MDDALTQPPMLVRAAVEKSKHLALGGAEHRDIVAALDLYRAAAAHRDLVDPPDVEPFYGRSEEHTSELQSLMRISYAVFCLKQKTTTPPSIHSTTNQYIN